MLNPTQGDFVELALGATETTETELGTLTMPPTARKIIGIYGTIEGISTTAEQLVGYFRLAFGNLSGRFKFPATSFQAPAGTLASPGFEYQPKIIPCDIDVVGNETIKCYAATFVAATGACRAMVGIIFQ